MRGGTGVAATGREAAMLAFRACRRHEDALPGDRVPSQARGRARIAERRDLRLADQHAGDRARDEHVRLPWRTDPEDGPGAGAIRVPLHRVSVRVGGAWREIGRTCALARVLIPDHVVRAGCQRGRAIRADGAIVGKVNEDPGSSVTVRALLLAVLGRALRAIPDPAAARVDTDASSAAMLTRRASGASGNLAAWLGRVRSRGLRDGDAIAIRVAHLPLRARSESEAWRGTRQVRALDATVRAGLRRAGRRLDAIAGSPVANLISRACRRGAARRVGRGPGLIRRACRGAASATGPALRVPDARACA